MFTIKPMPPQIPERLLARLEQVEVGTIGHFKHYGFAEPALRPVILDRRVAGTAVTVRVPGADSTLVHHVMSLARKGDFIIVDRCGDMQHAAWGGMVTHAAKAAGVVGAVIDGPVADLYEVRRCDLPIWCKGSSPLTTKLLALGGEINVPVNCGGLTINPGDAVLADESGIVALSPGEVELITEKGLEAQAREVDIIARLARGEKLADISGASTQVIASIEKKRGH